LFEQLVRSRTWLALDQTDSWIHEIFRAPDPERIASANDDSLLPRGEVDEKHRAAWKRASNERDVEFMGRLVAQVKAGDVYLASRESIERRHARALHPRDMDPCRLLTEPCGEHPQRRCASHDHQPAADDLDVSQGLDSDRSPTAASPRPGNHQAIGSTGKGLAAPRIDGMRDPPPVDLSQ
jgi:hypothetical protein